MRKELDEKLCAAFPNLYRDRHASMMATCMCWGFEFGDGWYDLVYRLSEKLEAEILKLPEEDRQQCCASQVKEKYGSIRFYLTTSTDKMEELIQEAEKESSKTCETCGEPGVLRGMGWLFTACDKHSEGQRPYSEIGCDEE